MRFRWVVLWCLSANAHGRLGDSLGRGLLSGCSLGIDYCSSCLPSQLLSGVYFSFFPLLCSHVLLFGVIVFGFVVLSFVCLCLPRVALFSSFLFRQSVAGLECQGVRTQVAGFVAQVFIDLSWVAFANCMRRGSNPRRGVRSPSFDRCVLGRFCKIVGGGVRTQVAGFEAQL